MGLYDAVTSKGPGLELFTRSARSALPTQLLELQGCLTAFFAKEDVTWACPAEGKLPSRAQSSGEPGQELASPSMDVSTPDAREKLKRRRYAAALKEYLTGWHNEMGQ